MKYRGKCIIGLGGDGRPCLDVISGNLNVRRVRQIQLHFL